MGEEGAVTCDEWVRTYGCAKKWGDVCKGLKVHPWGDCDFRVRDGCPEHCKEDPAAGGPTDPDTGGSECPATMPIKCDDGTCHVTQADCPGNAGGPSDSAA